jgi:hypothetical protein
MTPAAASSKEILAMAGVELSLKARVGYVALTLVSAAMTSVVVSLWLTEPFLPLRTEVAFGVMCLIGTSWCALAVWALRARRPLFARDRVIAGRMSVAFTALFTAGALAAVVVAGSPAAYGALGSGVGMLGAAIAVLTRARRRFAKLSARRMELERALGG